MKTLHPHCSGTAWTRGPCTPLPSHSLGSLEEPPTAVQGAEGTGRAPCRHPKGWGAFMYLCPKGELGGGGRRGERKKNVWVGDAHCLLGRLLPMLVSPELCPGARGGGELTSLPFTSRPLPCSNQPGWGAQQPSLPPVPTQEGKSWAWSVPCSALVVSMPCLHWPGG